MRRLTSYAIVLTMMLALLTAVPAFAVEAVDLTPSNNSVVDATAAYAKELPVIDGKIDAVWDITETLDTYNHFADQEPEGFEMATGYVKILWTEDALYFLSVVKDPTLTGIGEDSYTNMVNLWIAEVPTDDETYAAEGNYFLLLNSSGNWYTEYNNNGNAAMAAAEKAVQTYDDWYVQEIKMPIMTSGLQYSEGHVIGFEVSVDDDWDGDNVRDCYSNWNDAVPYWSDPSAMFGVRLQQTAEYPYRADRYGDEDQPVESTKPDTEDAPAETKEPQTGEDSTVTIGAITEEEPSLNMTVMIAMGAAIVVALLVVVIVVAIKRKKN